MKWVLLLVLTLSTVYSLDLIAPVDSLTTINDTVLFKWSDYNKSHDSYRLTLYDTRDNVLETFETTDSYMSLSGIDAKDYLWDVAVISAESIVKQSERFSFSVVEVNEDFSVDVDTSRYNSQGYIILNINAPLGSEVELKITGPGSPIEYKALELKNPELRTFISESGLYQLKASVVLGDYTDSFKDSFTVGSYDIQAASDDSNTENETDDGINDGFWKLRIKTISSNVTLPNVQFSYQIDGETYFNETDSKGHVVLLLGEGEYKFNFFKTGYYNLKKTIDLDNDTNLTVDLVKLKSTEDAHVVSKDTRVDFGLELVTPANNSKTKEDYLDFVFTVTKSDLECQLLLNAEQNPGWEVKAKRTGSNGTFTLNNLGSGVYKTRIKCSKDGEYDYSDIHYFTVGNAVKREDLVGSSLSKLDSLKKEIGGYDHFLKLSIEKLGVLQEISKAQDSLKKINSEYNDELDSGNPDKNFYLGKVSDALGSVPASIEISNPLESVVYLPSIGFDNLLNDYFEADIGLSEKEKKNLRKDLKSLQELLLLNIHVVHVNIIYNNSLHDIITLVDKDLDGINDIASKGYGSDITVYDYVEHIPYKEEVEFLAKSEMISDGLYKLELSPDNHLHYYIKGDLPLDMIKESTTIVVPYAGEESETSDITGLAASDTAEGSEVFNSIKTILLYVALFGFVLITGSVFIPGTPGYRLVQKDPSKQLMQYMNLLMDNIEKKGVEDSLQHFPKALNLFESLPDDQKVPFNPMIQYLAGCLDQHTLNVELDKLLESIVFQKNLIAYDPELYSSSITSYNDLLMRYNSLDESMKALISQKFQLASQGLTDIRNKYK